MLDDYNQLRLSGLTKVKRAAISHQIRLENIREREPRMLTLNELENAIKEELHLPSPSQQATNILRYIGDYVTIEGNSTEILPPEFSAIVGAPSRGFACDLVSELKNRGLVTGLFLTDMNGPTHIQDVSLTLSGWERYEAEKKGKISGSYGFIALKFGDDTLDSLMRDHVKPAISSLGYEAVDLRDVARTGIIDNLLRVQIRDAAFVIVDLTHDNSGAYWEAGYAEGLGKPVLYICEKTKFDQTKTHFDTNHCTTVSWSFDNIDGFLEEFIATLRRSLLI